MTEEDFLKRWARRKREVAEAEKPIPNEEAAPSVGAPDNQAAQGSDDKLDAEFDPASLPPIDSINAVSDVTAFLRAGVPAELTRAALRRVWTADPAIRDFVGLAENAWDFTDPNAMPGFGPLESTAEVRQMIADLVEQIGRAAQPAEPVARPEIAEVAEKINDSNALESEKHESPVVAVGSSATAQPPAVSAQDLSDAVLVQSNKENIATQRDGTEDTEKSRQSSPRLHGRALPR
jgi:hypothetical protein